MSSTARSLAGQVALVTGASRGIGRGIAVGLGCAGATVYITGRKPSGDPMLSPLQKTAEQITASGGVGITVYCDHNKDDDIEAVFKEIDKEQNGRLDILVNNAYSAVVDIATNIGTKFYNTPYTIYDKINGVGLRNHYVCTVLAAQRMTRRSRGLIITVGSPGGAKYLFNCAYGVGKAGCDRLAADTAVELQDANVAHVALWPGYVATETIQALESANATISQSFKEAETPEFVGKCVAALAGNPNLMGRTGKIVTTAELSSDYNITEADGRKPRALPPAIVDYIRYINELRSVSHI